MRVKTAVKTQTARVKILEVIEQLEISRAKLMPVTVASVCVIRSFNLSSSSSLLLLSLSVRASRSSSSILRTCSDVGGFMHVVWSRPSLFAI